MASLRTKKYMCQNDIHGTNYLLSSPNSRPPLTPHNTTAFTRYTKSSYVPQTRLPVKYCSAHPKVYAIIPKGSKHDTNPPPLTKTTLLWSAEACFRVPKSPPPYNFTPSNPPITSPTSTIPSPQFQSPVLVRQQTRTPLPG